MELEGLVILWQGPGKGPRGRMRSQQRGRRRQVGKGRFTVTAPPLLSLVLYFAPLETVPHNSTDYDLTERIRKESKEAYFQVLERDASDIIYTADIYGA